VAFGYRPDGDLVRDLDATRRIMQFIMRRRNESAVTFEQKIDPRPGQAFLSAARERTGLKASMLHLVLWAASRTLHERPRLNRFVAGTRLYQRRGIQLSFSAKKSKTDEGAIFTVKRGIDPAWTFDELVRRIDGDVKDGRSDKVSATDRELSVLLRLPGFLLDLLVRLQFLLDRWGLLPEVFYRNDPLYASAYIANLGSLNMDPAYHHLFEYGNIPIFIMVGAIREEVVVGGDGKPSVEPRMTLKYTFDERVEDGLYCLRALETLKRCLEAPDAAKPAGERS